MMAKKSAVATIGRFQPATLMHKKLADTIKDRAIEINGDPYVFATRTTNYPKYISNKGKTKKKAKKPKTLKNPLTIKQKLHWLKTVINDDDINIKDTKHAFSALNYLKENGYTDIHFILGNEPEKIKLMSSLLKYNSKHNPNINIIPILLERDMVNETSGTKVRDYANKGDIKAVMRNTGLNEKDANRLTLHIQTGITPREKRPKPITRKRKRGKGRKKKKKYKVNKGNKVNKDNKQ